MIVSSMKTMKTFQSGLGFFSVRVRVISSKYDVLSNHSNSNIPQLQSQVFKDDIKNIDENIDRR
jgi:hypothetical protein